MFENVYTLTEKKYNDASSRVRELQAAQFENNERCVSFFSIFPIIATCLHSEL